MGARPQDPETNEKYDLTPYIELFSKYLDSNSPINYGLYIPSGVWTMSPITLAPTGSYGGFDIRGDFGFFQKSNEKRWGTVITTYNSDEQTHLIIFGSSGHFWESSYIDGITFSSANVVYTSGVPKADSETRCKITDTLVRFYNCEFAKFGYLNFMYFDGTALCYKNSWEIYIEHLNIRSAGGTEAKIIFETLGEEDSGNISACHIGYLMFENAPSNLFEVQDGSGLINFDIGTINIEQTLTWLYGVDTKYDGYSTDNGWDADSAIHQGVFDVQGNCSFNIGCITMNNVAYGFFTIDEAIYTFDRMIMLNQDFNHKVQFLIGSVDFWGTNKNFDLAYCNHTNEEIAEYISSSYMQPKILISIREWSDVSGNSYKKYFNFTNFKGRIKVPNNFNVYAINYTNYSQQISPSMIPAYELIDGATAGNSTIQYDADSKNKAKLVVKAYSTSTYSRIIEMSGIPTR